MGKCRDMSAWKLLTQVCIYKYKKMGAATATQSEVGLPVKW